MKEEKTRNFNRRYKEEYGICRKIFYFLFLHIVVAYVANFMYKLKVEGRENIPKDRKRRIIFAANHVSEIDPPMVSKAVNTFVAYMAKKELFEEKGIRGWLVKRLGAFAVNRMKPEIATFKTVNDIMQTSWYLGIFPEGTTKHEGKIEDIRNGFVRIAKHAKADIIPVSICNWTGYAKKLFEKDLRIVIGKPISYELDTDEIVQQWCAEICKNTGFENCMAKSEVHDNM